MAKNTASAVRGGVQAGKNVATASRSASAAGKVVRAAGDDVAKTSKLKNVAETADKSSKVEHVVDGASMAGDVAMTVLATTAGTVVGDKLYEVAWKDQETGGQPSSGSFMGVIILLIIAALLCVYIVIKLFKKRT
eukprot:jgi/Mesvir1/26748/Mv20524-RA.1